MRNSDFIKIWVDDPFVAAKYKKKKWFLSPMAFLKPILVLVNSDHPELTFGVMLLQSKWREFIFCQKKCSEFKQP
jgi:hypothetical protein